MMTMEELITSLRTFGEAGMTVEEFIARTEEINTPAPPAEQVLNLTHTAQLYAKALLQIQDLLTNSIHHSPDCAVIVNHGGYRCGCSNVKIISEVHKIIDDAISA